MGWLASRFHAAGMALAANHYPHLEDEAGYRLVASKIDIICDEHGYTRGGKAMLTDKKWAQYISLFADLARTKAVLVIDQLTRDPSRVTPEILDWSLANYLLMKGDRTYLAWPTEGVYGRFDNYPQLYLPIGRPLQPLSREGNVYRRRFEKVIALVNPASTAAASYRLEAGRWYDLTGLRRSGVVSLPPASGLILVGGRPWVRND
jgi:hypothetical protein